MSSKVALRISRSPEGRTAYLLGSEVEDSWSEEEEDEEEEEPEVDSSMVRSLASQLMAGLGLPVARQRITTSWPMFSSTVCVHS